MDTIHSVTAEPYEFVFSRRHTALLVIDLQRDFLRADGFASAQGTDMVPVQDTVPHIKRLLDLFRDLNMAVFHTREGHVPDLSDCPSSKLLRNLPCRPKTALKIGDKGPMGRLLVRGEYGHDIVDELQPFPDEVIIDKPGKGSFWNTSLMNDLRARSITHLIVCGVTTECCFATTIREANDRGFECCGIREATAGFNDTAFKNSTLSMLTFAGGLFGFMASMQAFEGALSSAGKANDMRTRTNGDSKTHVNGDSNGANDYGVTNGHSSTKNNWTGDMSIAALRSFYKSGGSILVMVEALYDRIKKYEEIDSAVWIHLLDQDKFRQSALDLERRYPDPSKRPALYGVPFSMKDSFDVANIPTTAACLPLRYVPTTSSAVCRKLVAAGALFLGKVNMDQFATGLSGCRSPFGTPHSTFSKKFISGGSSSGSAVSVASRCSSFSIATDTAGSGRVPAGFNGVVGFKPTPGTVSAVGFVPACPSLDCASVMALSVDDARTVYNVIAGYDAADPYAKWAVSRPRPVHALGLEATRFRFGTPSPEALSVCCPIYKKKFNEVCDALVSIGGVKVEAIDWMPFEKAGNLLYNGTFVSERLATLPENWLRDNKPDLHPVVAELFQAVEDRQSTAQQAYRDLMAKARYTRQAEHIFRAGEGGIDLLVVPTAPAHWTIEEMQEKPIERNSALGAYTHFGNVLDLCAVAAPAGTYKAHELGSRCPSGAEEDDLPFGATFIGLSGTDAEVLEVARRFETRVAVDN